MSDKLKVSFTTINVTKNGQLLGKGHIYWNFTVDGEPVADRPYTNPLPVVDGQTVVLSKFLEVTKDPSGQQLTIYGKVSEKDGLSQDELDDFSDTYTKATNWGIGTHRRELVDRQLNVTITYKVERA